MRSVELHMIEDASAKADSRPFNFACTDLTFLAEIHRKRLDTQSYLNAQVCHLAANRLNFYQNSSPADRISTSMCGALLKVHKRRLILGNWISTIFFQEFQLNRENQVLCRGEKITRNHWSQKKGQVNWKFSGQSSPIHLHNTFILRCSLSFIYNPDAI